MTSPDSTGNRFQATGFIGRRQELAALTAALDDALAGRGQIVMLAGEPGIGKTRMAQELAALAAARGAQVLWGWCYEQEGAPPYWPWVQAVRAYISVTEPKQLRAQMGPGAADIAEVIPEVHGRLPDLKPPPVLDPNQARFRFFDSIATLFKNAARTQPLVLVLDDLHWADKPSLLLLEFLARQISESSLMVVGTYRDAEVSNEHPLFGTLAQLSRNQSFHRQVLEGLAPADVGEFILATKGSEASQELVDAVYAHTEGNPFFMNEVIRLLVERGELGDASVDGGTSALAVPQGVLEVIGQRLNRLSKECNDLLTTAAIIGRQFDFNLLGVLADGITELELLGMVEEALAAQVVQELPEAGDRYQFSHALVQQTLLGRLSSSRRVRLHARVGEVLETLYGDHPGDHAAELAYHFAEAEPVVGTGKLVNYTLLAGERALEAYAHEEALGHFQRGLIAKGLDIEGAMPAPDAEAAALLFGLGRAQAATLPRHQAEEAVAALRRSFDYYAANGDVPRAVSVAEYPVAGLAGRTTEMDQLIASAQELVPPQSLEAGRLLSLYGTLIGIQGGDYHRAQEALNQALAIAQSEEDAALEMRTLTAAAQVDLFHIRIQETLEKSLKAIDLARRTDDPRVEVEARHWATAALTHMGSFEAMQLHSLAMLALAERLRDRWWLAGALWRHQTVPRLKGDWQAAREYSDRGLDVSPMEPRLLSGRVLLDYEVGDFAEGEAHMERLLESMRLTPPGPSMPYVFAALVIPMVARITGVADRPGVAAAAAEIVLSSPSATPYYAMLARVGLGLLAVQRGDVPLAAEQYAALEPQRGTMLIGGIAAVDRVLGLLSRTMGELDQATAHFEDSLAFCRKAGCRPELAWTCHDYAGALHERNGHGDRSRAISLLDESLTIASELGMRPLIERVKGLQERTEAQPVRAPAYPDGLTQREIEVLRLVCGGKTDREIGEALVISAKTVGKHVSNILNKTNSANRAEAATYAARHDIVADPVTD